MSFNKGEVTMRNYYKLLLLIMVLAISGCGSGATSADPLGTDTISVIAAPTSLGAGESSVITATVKHKDGTVATLRSVTFIVTSTTGGSIDVSEKDIDGNGVATVNYTAGTGVGTVQDKVKASISNGASATVLITRTNNSVVLADSCGGVVAASGSCTITATVTNNSGAPASGIDVSFDISTKGTGSPKLSPLPVAPATTTVVTTDGNGVAKTIYTAGATAGMTDWITATITGGSAAIFITD